MKDVNPSGGNLRLPECHQDDRTMPMEENKTAVLGIRSVTGRLPQCSWRMPPILKWNAALIAQSLSDGGADPRKDEKARD